MNIGKSLKIAMAQNDKVTKWVADELKVSVSQVNYWKSREHVNSQTVERLAELFELKPSEFIALSES